ncbi:MAG: redoxin family protein [Candidatus Doudnabacteria bacterium]|nr:redoxin family protein [Candidatus Doudnabacteria bacterium]
MNSNNIRLTFGVLIIVLLFVGAGMLLFKSQSKPRPVDESSHGQFDPLLDKPLPELDLYDKDGNVYTVESFKGKNVVLFFNEGIMCYPACWDQIAAFGTDERFNNDQTAAFSVVTDQPRDWERAQEKMPDLAKAKLLFDRGAAASRRLGMLDLPSSMHGGVMPGHTYIVLDKEGIVTYIHDDPAMGNNNDLIASKVGVTNNY